MTPGNKHLFGTDGIRQEVGTFPLDDISIPKLGYAFGKIIKDHNVRIIIGRDTRNSGQHIQQLLTHGIKKANPPVIVESCGVIPTPGLSYITREFQFDFGIMITASHNPYSDNGIKFFNSQGEKLSESIEKEIEEFFYRIHENTLEISTFSSTSITPENESYSQKYAAFLTSHAREIESHIRERKMRAVIDCANGATYRIAEEIFKEAGFKTIMIGVQPDGKNINRECGSTHTSNLIKAIQKENANIGIAFDGDGDRLIMADSKGRLLDGDHILYHIAIYFKNITVPQFNDIIVGTQMSNLGLEKALIDSGFTFLRTKVGDKYVYQGMNSQNAILGGEPSGHTIISTYQKSGDGILTALFFLKALSTAGISSVEAFDNLLLYPQEMRDIKIKERKNLEEWDQLQRMIREFNETYQSDSRLLIRYSGTEPKIRLMMESKRQIVIDENLGKFEALIQSTIGLPAESLKEN